MKELIEKAIQINQELGAKLKELEELEDLEEPNLLGADGKYFTAKITDRKCKGRVRVEGGEVYLCQDEVDGYDCQNKYGYKYSYVIEKGTEDDLELADITNLKLWDYLPKEGEYFYVKPESTREYIAIAKEGEDITHSYANLNLDSKDFYWSGRVCNDSRIKELRPATLQEIAFLDAKLKENGKYFDQATMSIKDIENEPAFKVGDWVLITKPKDVIHDPIWPYWSSSMDKYDGQTLEIEEINSDGYLVIDGWKFNSDWCKKVEAPKPNKPKVGDLCIFWDNDKSEAIVGIMTDMRPFNMNPYLVSNLVLFYNCIPFESVEQYLEFING